MSDTTTKPSEAAPITEQELDSLIQRIDTDPAARARIDALLAEAEQRGGERSSDDVFADLKAKLKAYNAN